MGGLLAVVLSVFACGGRASSPTAPSATPTSTSTSVAGNSSTVSLTGRAVDALTTVPEPALSVRIEDGSAATTDSDGAFTISTTAGQHAVTLTGNGVVDRQTALRVPSAGTVVSLIPSSFDLAAFNEMCRSGSDGLRRWDTAPKLVVIDTVLEFTSESDATYTATAERLPASDRDGLVADLAWGLPQLTGGTFGAFSSVGTESPQAGAQVSFFVREGTIVVARFRNLQASTGSSGYGRWAFRSNVVVAGAVMLDRDVDAAPGPYSRSLRVHELGHALGWNDVTVRTSAMNHIAVNEPNAFDRDATRLAFLRPPGNVAPDRDPASFSVNFRAFPMVWGPITP